MKVICQMARICRKPCRHKFRHIPHDDCITGCQRGRLERPYIKSHLGIEYNLVSDLKFGIAFCINYEIWKAHMKPGIDFIDYRVCFRYNSPDDGYGEPLSSTSQDSSDIDQTILRAYGDGEDELLSEEQMVRLGLARTDRAVERSVNEPPNAEVDGAIADWTYSETSIDVREDATNEED